MRFVYLCEKVYTCIMATRQDFSQSAWEIPSIFYPSIDHLSVQINQVDLVYKSFIQIGPRIVTFEPRSTEVIFSIGKTCPLENFQIVQSGTKGYENQECSAVQMSLPLIEVQMRQSVTDLDKILGVNHIERLNFKLI